MLIEGLRFFENLAGFEVVPITRSQSLTAFSRVLNLLAFSSISFPFIENFSACLPGFIPLTILRSSHSKFFITLATLPRLTWYSGLTSTIIIFIGF